MDQILFDTKFNFKTFAFREFLKIMPDTLLINRIRITKMFGASKNNLNKPLALMVIVAFIAIALIVDIAIRVSGVSFGKASTKGDYTIIFNPNVRADTFILEKTTGKTWQLMQYVDLEGDPRVWKYVDRIDDAKGMADFVSTQKFKNLQNSHEEKNPTTKEVEKKSDDNKLDDKKSKKKSQK